MKKVLMILMCVCMILCFMPTMAFAAEDADGVPSTVQDAVDNQGEVSGENNEDTEAGPEAKIGETNYDTLDAAIEAAGAADTIELLKD